jgi:hypothetical protein
MGRIIDFRADRDSEVYLGEGWSQAEADGAWTVGPESSVLLRLAADLELDSSLVAFRATPFVSEAHPELRVELRANGASLERWVFGLSDGAEQHKAAIPAGAVGEDRRLRLDFVFENPASPAALGLSPDARRLGLRFKTLLLQDAYPTYALGAPLDFSSSSVEAHLHSGWYDRESEGRWTQGDQAALRFRVDERADAVSIRLTIHARPFLPGASTPLEVDVSANGTPVAHWTYASSEAAERRAEIPGSILEEDGKLDVVLQIEEPRSPEELGLSSDTRKLGLLVRSLLLDSPD